jgi:hypothetical protein
MQFEILGEVSQIETFATGSRIREIERLRKIYGRGRWRKRKGLAHVRLADGTIRLLNYTGTKLVALDEKNTRSSI